MADARRKVTVRCGDSATAHLEPNSLDAVFTDPPYFGNVQYGELMDFCYVWLRKLVGGKSRGFKRPSTRSPRELTGNVTQSRGLDHFTQGLSAVYSRMAEALKPGAPLVFTYHHNKLKAYCAVGVAILDAGLTCSASLPCPAEMGGSIHIRGTSSSIIDTVFVCRDQGQTSRQWLFGSITELSPIVANDLVQISMSGHKPTRGDARCVALGHLTRMAIWNLRERWDTVASTNEKLARFAEEVNAFGDLNRLLGRMEEFERLSDWRDETRSYTQLESRILDAVTF